MVYFSCTGNTRAVAETISSAVGADLVEIVPQEPYTDEDLNYNNSDCRANVEMNDDTARPAIQNTIENIADYDVIYVGYPIWWSDMPRIMYTFFDTYDFSGKTIAPFCTSGGRLLFSFWLAVGLGLGVMGIAHAMCLDWTLRAVIFLIRLKREKWKSF